MLYIYIYVNNQFLTAERIFTHIPYMQRDRDPLNAERRKYLFRLTPRKRDFLFFSRKTRNGRRRRSRRRFSSVADTLLYAESKSGSLNEDK